MAKTVKVTRASSKDNGMTITTKQLGLKNTKNGVEVIVKLQQSGDRKVFMLAGKVSRSGYTVYINNIPRDFRAPSVGKDNHVECSLVSVRTV